MGIRWALIGGSKTHLRPLGIGSLVAVCLLGFGAPRLLGQGAAEAQRPGNAAEQAAVFHPAVSILPATTEGFVELQELPRLIDRWQETSLADLQHDPAMKPFLDSQRDVIAAKLSEIGVQAGITFRDLQEAVSGELVVAWLRFSDTQRPFSVALLADTRGRDAGREALLAKVDKNLREREAVVSSMAVRGYPATLYTLPRKKGQVAVERLGVIEVQGRVIVSDRMETIAGLVSEALDGPRRALEQMVEYRGVFSQPSLSEVRPEPHVRWFARPLELGLILRELAEIDRGNNVDVIQLLQDQGFDAIRAVGGRIYLATEHYDILHRGFVYAPATTPGEEKYKLAAAMLQFPQHAMTPPPEWILPEAATYFLVNWKLEKAFWASETLVDGAFNSEFFRKTLKGIRDDPKGIQIDFADEVVSKLGEAVVFMSDNRTTEQGTQERVLAAIRLREPEEVAATLNGSLSRDPDIYKMDYPHHVLWEVRPSAEEEGEDPFFEISGGFGSFNDGAEEVESTIDEETLASEPVLERMGITVFDGHLFLASHSEMLVELIDHARSSQQRFGNHPASLRVYEAILREGGKERSMEWILRSDLTWRVKYELLRTKHFLESDSLLASLIRRGKERAEKAKKKNQPAPEEIDLTQLPPFASIRDYLQPGGGFATTDQNGWTMTQFLLRKPAK